MLGAINSSNSTAGVIPSNMLSGFYASATSLLFVMVFISAFAIVYVKYESRQTFFEYSAALSSAGKIKQRHLELLMEQADLTNRVKVLSKARNMGMHKPAKVIVLDEK